MRHITSSVVLLAAALACGNASAQQQAGPQPFPQSEYGPSIGIDDAMKVAAAAAAEAKKNNWAMSIAVVGTSGDLMYFERLGNTSFASIDLSIHKARAAARFRSPTGRFAERLAAGPANIYLLSFDGFIAGRGGELIVAGGKVIGAIGVSGSTAAHDEQVTRAGVNAIK
ncbi:MAG TPA: heme-binding protein [Pseudolabrys sp.]|nr:heme-binding protein [Pseudolabrys sp.]